MSELNFWTGSGLGGRLSRRRMLRGTAVTGLGLGAAALIGCGGDDEPAPAGGTKGGATGTTPGAEQVKRGGTHIWGQSRQLLDVMDPHTSLSEAAVPWLMVGNRAFHVNKQALAEPELVEKY